MYVKITDGAVDTYPYSVEQLKVENPNVSFPKDLSEELLESYGVHLVTLKDRPEINHRTQKTEEAATPVLEDGAWVLNWVTSDKTAEEIQGFDDAAARFNREQRDAKLAETDYLALSDNTMSAEMTTYRQALRDITAHENWPNLSDDNWPVKPS